MEGGAAAYRYALLLQDSEGNAEGGAQDGRQAPRHTGTSSSGISDRGATQGRHQTVTDLKRAATPGSSSRLSRAVGRRSAACTQSRLPHRGESIGAGRTFGHPIEARIGNVMNGCGAD